jgi:hypothetical protein
MTNLKEKIGENFPYTLPVQEGYDNVRNIGSDIEPVDLVARPERGIIGGYESLRVAYDSWWLVVQKGQPILIQVKRGDQDSNYMSWEAYSCDHLPAGKGVYRK